MAAAEMILIEPRRGGRDVTTCRATCHETDIEALWLHVSGYGTMYTESKALEEGRRT